MADVDRTPDAALTLRVELADPALRPTPGLWRKKFESIVHQAYVFRGVEVTASAILRVRLGTLVLDLPDGRRLQLCTLRTPVPKPPSGAATQPSTDGSPELASILKQCKDGEPLSVTGTLEESEDGPRLEVRTHYRPSL